MIDFATIATDLTAQVTSAVLAAIGIGVLVLGARLGWKFFKKFSG